MMEILRNLARAIPDLLVNIKSVFVGMFTSVLGLLLPIKDIVHLILFLFMIDVFFGYWAARKLRKESFSVKLIWSHTIPRMLIALTMVISTYIWDKVYNVNEFSTYKIIGWFISGVLLYSIAHNGYKITKWSVFPNIFTLIKRRIEETLKLPFENGTFEEESKSEPKTDVNIKKQPESDANADCKKDVD